MNRALLMATSDAARFDVMIQSPEGIVFHPGLTLSDINALMGEGSVTFLCPTEWISFIDIDLPKVKPSLLRTVVANLVEEQLAEPIEHVHCSIIAPYVTEGKTPVAIIHHDRLNQVLQQFKEADLHLEFLVPDFYALPVINEGWSCWKHADRCIVRQDAYHGFSLHGSEMASWTASIDQPAQLEEMTDVAIHTYLKTMMNTVFPLNLLQGDFAPTAKKKNINLFSTSLIVLGVSVIVYFIYLIGVGAILSNRLTGLQSQTLALYQQVFPGATQATSPRVLLSRELQKKGQSQQRFFVLMSALTQGLSKDKSVELMHVQFTGDRLTATITAKDFSALESLPTYFDAHQVIFKQENAEQLGDHVEARIQLEVTS